MTHGQRREIRKQATTAIYFELFCIFLPELVKCDFSQFQKSNMFVKKGCCLIYCPCGYANKEEKLFDVHSKTEHAEMFKLFADFRDFMRPSFQRICELDFRKLGATNDAQIDLKCRIRDLYRVKFLVRTQYIDYGSNPKNRERKRIAYYIYQDRDYMTDQIKLGETDNSKIVYREKSLRFIE